MGSTNRAGGSAAPEPGVEVAITAASGNSLLHSSLLGNSGLLAGKVKLMVKPGTSSRTVGLRVNGSTSLKYIQRYSTPSGDANDSGSSSAILFLIEDSGTLEFDWEMDAKVDGSVRLLRIRENQSNSAAPTGHVWMTVFWANTSTELISLEWYGGASDTFLQGSRSRIWQYL